MIYKDFNLKVKLNSDGSITSTWDFVPGAERYYINIHIPPNDGYVYESSMISPSINYNVSTPGIKDGVTYEVILYVGSGKETEGQKVRINIPYGFYDNTPMTVPQNIKASANALSVKISFDKVAHARSYDILFDGVVYNTTDNSKQFNGLTAKTAHTYAVRARGVNHIGDYSPTMSIMTLPITPAIPGGIRKTATENTATISWGAVSNATSYDLKFNGLIYSVSGTSKTFTGLAAGRSYDFQISSRNADAASSYSSVVTVVTPPYPPSTVSATSTGNTIDIKWNAVEGTRLYGIKVEWLNVNWMEYTSFEPFILLEKVLPNTKYTYQICARSVDGIGSYTTPRTIWTLPGAPVLPGYTGQETTENSATIRWNEVPGATGYDLLFDNKVYSLTGTSKTFTGLLPDTSYSYQVRARTSNGTGEYSEESTIRTTSKAPDSISKSSSEDSVTLSWASAPGATGYDVMFNGEVYGVSGTSKTFSGLKPNTEYSYKVRTKNANGASSYGSEKVVKTAPQSPSISRTSTTKNSAELYWDRVAGATSYDVLFDGKVYNTTGGFLYVDGLMPDTEYSYSVRANNADGSSSYSEVQKITTQQTVPGVPTNLNASATVDSVTVTWSAVKGATSYDLNFGNSTYEVTNTTKTITGLEQGQEYSYTVRAKNAKGNGSYAEWKTVTTAKTPPPVPANVRAGSTTNAVSISWDATVRTTKYEVKLNNSVYSVNTPGITIGNLTANTSYSYAVRAFNEAGASAYSTLASIMTKMTRPAMPTNLSATSTTNSVTIKWSAVSTATSYNIPLSGGSTTYTTTGTSITITGLLSGTDYYYAVSATNSAGEGPLTKAYLIRTKDVMPAVPTNVNAEATSDTVYLIWNKVQGAASYDIIFNNVVYNTTETTREFKNLASNQNYNYGVRAKNTAGISAYSQIKTIRTRLKTPENIRAVPKKNSVQLSWDPVTGASGYKLQFDSEEYYVTEAGKELTELQADTEYLYSVCAVNEFVTSDFSKIEQVKTLGALPLVPEDVHATSTMNSVTVKWGPVALAESYLVEFDGVVYEVPVDKPKSRLLRSAVKLEGESFRIFTGLKPYTVHTYRVSSVNEYGSRGYCPLKSIVTKKSKKNGLPNGKMRRRYLDGKKAYMGLDPVNAITGAFLWSYTCLEDEGKDNLHFTMMYDSQRGEYVKTLGKKWSHSMNYLLHMEDKHAYFSTPYDDVTPFLIDDENGRYQLDDEFGSDYRMEKDDQGYSIRDKDGTTYIFNDNLSLSKIMEGGLISYHFGSDQEGRMTWIEGRNGSRLEFTYQNIKIAEVTDRSGNTVQFLYQGEDLIFAGKKNESGITFTYDGLSNLLQISDFTGQTYLTNEYDIEGRVRVQDTAGRGKSYVLYNEIEKVTVFTDEQGNQTQYRYNDYYQVTDVTMGEGGLHNRYDNRGMLVEQTDPLGNSTLFEYDWLGRMNQVTHPDQTIEQITYDDNHNPVQIVNRDEAKSSYTYDAANNLISACDERDKTCYYTYDTNHNLVTYTDKCEGVWTYQYDENNHLTQGEDPEGNVYGYSHDTAGRLLSYVTPAGRETQYRYSQTGDLLEITDADGTLVFDYDKNGAQTGITDKMGHKQHLEYNQMGQVIMATDFMGNEYHFEYDKKGNLIKETDPLGYAARYDYDALGNRTAYIDKSGRKTTYTFDAASQVTEVKDAGDNVIHYTYDSMGQIQTVTDAMQNQTAYAYNKAGHVTKITNALGHSVSYTYDPCGNLLSKTDENGTVISYTYDNENRLSTMISELGTVQFLYDSLGRVIEIQDTDHQSERSKYDGDGNVTEYQDKEGNKKYYSYDGTGKVSQIIDNLGAVTSFQYDKNGNCIKVTDALGNETVNTYDANNRMVKTTNPLGHEVTYEYDARGDLIAVTDPRGGKRSYSYDKNGNLTREVTPERGTKNYTYDDLNRLVKVEDEEYNKSFFEYDANGNLITYTDPNQNKWEYRYDALNQLVSVTDQADGSLIMEYTKTGNIAKITDQEGAETSYTYDSMGRLLEMSDALQHSLSWTYDSQGRILTQTDAKGNITRYTYSPNGNLLSIIDGEENCRSFTYNALGQILCETDPEGNQKNYEYDLLGQVTSLTDEAGNKTLFTYNANGQISTVTDPGGNKTQYKYDPNGNLIERTDPLGNITAFEYDAVNNQVREYVSTDRQQAATVYQYDKKGNVIREINAVSDMKYFYPDANGNITTIIDEEDEKTVIRYDLNNLPVHMSHSDGKEATFRYNKRGELVELKDWNGTVNLSYGKTGLLEQVTDQSGKTTGYRYDENGNVSAVCYPDGSMHQYEYDRNNRITKVTDPEANVTRYDYTRSGRIKALHQPGSKASFEYNQKGLPVKANYQFDDLTTVEEQFTYDSLGNMLSANRTGNTKQLERQASYTYDALGQLTTVKEGSRTQSYEYDLLGNRISKLIDGIPKTSYTYDSLNRLQEMVEDGERYSFGYDKRGNLLEERRGDRVIKQYRYDTAGRMQHGRNLETGETTDYSYNALSMRIKRIQKLQNRPDGYKNSNLQTGGSNAPYHTKEIQYVTDYLSGTNNELMTYEKGFGAIQTVFGYGYERLSQKMLPENGTQLTPRSTIAATIEQAYFQQDLWGSSLLAATKKGAILSYTAKDIWGTSKHPEREDLNGSGLEGNLRFTNYCYDSVIDKQYAQARFYDAETGRMLSKDPVRRSLNGYPYCNNNPAGYVDPTGEVPAIIGGVLGGVVGGAFGFAGSALSQWIGGEDFSLKKALGSAANGAVVGAVRGGLIGSGVGIGLGLASNFAAGAVGSALEQKISKGTVSFGDSIVGGLTNVVSGAIYGNKSLKTLGNAVVRGALSGATTAGINNLYDAWKDRNQLEYIPGIDPETGRLVSWSSQIPYGRSRDPRASCGSSNPFRGSIGYRTVKGYRYLESESTGSRQTRRRGFRVEGLVKDILVGAVIGGMSSAVFYEAGKAVTYLKESFRNKGSSNTNPRLKMDLQYFADKGGGNNPNYIVTSKGTVMDTSKNYNLIGSGEKGDWFQIHNYGKPETGFSFPHTHSPQINTNGAYTSVNRIVSNTTEMDINLADQLLRTGQMVIRKGRR